MKLLHKYHEYFGNNIWFDLLIPVLIAWMTILEVWVWRQ